MLLKFLCSTRRSINQSRLLISNLKTSVSSTLTTSTVLQKQSPASSFQIIRQISSGNSLHRKMQHHELRTVKTTTSEHMRVDEIRIPVSWGGHISGQIFSHTTLHPANLLTNHSSPARAIVSLHGYLDNSNSFKPLAFEILKKSQDYYIIALDLPGNFITGK
jgi:hypothetical protein